MLKWLLFLGFISLAACTNKDRIKKEAAANKGVERVQRAKSILHGYWYQESYIKSLAKTKSPFRSQNALGRMVELDIDTTKVDGDSLEIGAPSIHEGNSFVLYFRPGTLQHRFPTNLMEDEEEKHFFEIGYSLLLKDTSLNLYTYNDRKKVIRETRYLRAPQNPAGPLQYMINQTLFTGTYRGEDSSGKTCTLVFTSDGGVTGIPGFQKYFVMADFNAGPSFGVDEVCLDIQTPNQRCFGFSLMEDTLKLYDYIEDRDTSRFGNLKYRLTRQR